VAALLWGTTGLAARLIPSDVPLQAQTLGFVRLAIGAPVLLCGALLVPGAGGGRFGRRHLPLTLVFGGMIAAYQVAFFTSVGRLGVSIGTLVPLGTSPLFAAFLAWTILGERPPAGVLLACAAAIAGLACLTGVTLDGMGSRS